MIGIYGIYNKESEKWYVGQSVDIDKRFRHHKWGLSNGYHPNKHLLNAWNKYGKDSFEFRILERCDEKELDEKEITWISKLDSKNNGYNQCDGGNAPRGRVVSEEMKRQMSIERTGAGNPFYGHTWSKEQRQAISERQLGEKNHMYGRVGKEHPRSIPVKCIETDVVYESARQAQMQTGVNRNNISSCCSGRLKTAGGYHWEKIV